MQFDDIADDVPLPENLGTYETLEEAFAVFREHPVEQLRVQVRRARAEQLRQLFATPEEMTPEQFNREVWLFEASTVFDGKSITKEMNGELSKGRARELKQALQEGRLELHGNYCWSAATKVFAPRLNGQPEEQKKHIATIRRILCDEELLPVQKSLELKDVYGLGDSVATGLVMLVHPDKFAVWNGQSQVALQTLRLLNTPLETFQGEFRSLRERLNARDCLELDWFLYLINQKRIVIDGEDVGPTSSKYWRIGTSDGKAPRNRWPLMRDGNFVAIGWPALGELTFVDGSSGSMERLKTLLNEKYPGEATTIGRYCKQLSSFVRGINTGDIIVASDGGTVLGIGQVTGEYEYDSTSDFPNRRPVEWLSLDQWRLPENEDFRSTLRAIKQAANISAITVRINPLPPLSPIPQRIQAILERKSQVILYGPPGTGKTYWAQNAARELGARHAFAKAFDQLDPSERKTVIGDEQHAGLVRTCCFHPAYGYEDFLQGYRPDAATGQMTFALRDGIFKQLCTDATAAPDRRFYLIIDEINRGDIPRIFGELLTVLEQDKRGMAITLPVNGARFAVPKNVFLIGTMNTADRSISLLDAALRRRFGFIELMPDPSVLDPHAIEKLSLSGWLHALNERIRSHIGRDARNLQIGHSYLLREGKPVQDPCVFGQILRDDIIPLIEEYCYEDYSAMVRILGRALVDGETQRIQHHLFAAGMESELLAALHAEFNGHSRSHDAGADRADELVESDESFAQ